jgi:flagellar biosynthesis protein FlhG
MTTSENEARPTDGTLAKACETFLQVRPPLAAIVHRDPLVKDCIRHQAPMLTRHPNATAATDIHNLARALAAE